MKPDQIEGHERDLWRYLYESEHSARDRRRYHRAFRKFFPNRHKESLRDIVREFGEEARKGTYKDDPIFGYLDEVHPEAFELIAEYGTDYTPYMDRKPPKYGEPKVGDCYLNSWRLLAGFNASLDRRPRIKNRTRFVYAEGIVMGPIVNPMMHGWVARGLEGVRAIDWTFYATCKWTRYLGIPFTDAEHKELADLIGRGNLFEKAYFNEKAKRRLVEMLQERRQATAT